MPIYEADKTYQILTEPITGSNIHIYALRYLGGDETPAAYVVSCHPERFLLDLHDLSNMVFLLETNVVPNQTHHTLVKAELGSALIPIQNNLYSGIVFRIIKELDFIELKETVNAERVSKALENPLSFAQEETKQVKHTQEAKLVIGA